jgi:hypothetical protein
MDALQVYFLQVLILIKLEKEKDYAHLYVL